MLRHTHTMSRRAPQDQPIDAWLKQELGRSFDDTLDETLPDELLDLLRDMPPTRH